MAGQPGRSGGARPGAGRPRKSVTALKLAGTFRKDRHADRLPEEERDPFAEFLDRWDTGSQETSRAGARMTPRRIVKLASSKAGARPDPPPHLRAETAQWWRDVLERWELEAHDIHLLTLAAESLDRVAECRQRIAAEGLTVAGKDGGMVKHPLLSVEARARDQARALIAQLRLPALEDEAPGIDRRGA